MNQVHPGNMPRVTAFNKPKEKSQKWIRGGWVCLDSQQGGDNAGKSSAVYTTQAANPNLGSYQFQCPSGAVTIKTQTYTCRGGMRQARTLPGKRLSPQLVGPRGCICVGTRCQQAGPVTGQPPDSQLPDPGPLEAMEGDTGSAGWPGSACGTGSQRWREVLRAGGGR